MRLFSLRTTSEDKHHDEDIPAGSLVEKRKYKRRNQRVVFHFFCTEALKIRLISKMKTKSNKNSYIPLTHL